MGCGGGGGAAAGHVMELIPRWQEFGSVPLFNKSWNGMLVVLTQMMDHSSSSSSKGGQPSDTAGKGVEFVCFTSGGRKERRRRR